MKRTIATLGVVGLALMAATVGANAAPPDKADDEKKISICHHTASPDNPYRPETINLKALAAHVSDTEDIVPANAGDIMPNGQNNDATGMAILANGCDIPPVVVEPVVVEPVVVEPVVEPVVVPEAVVPPVVVPEAVVPPAVAPPAVAPPAAPRVAPVAAAPRAAAPAVPAASNLGYNVQTAVGDMPGTGIPAWLAALTGLFTAVGALVLAKGGLRSRSANG